MRPTGHRWRRLKERFKADCRNRLAVCWRCRQVIDYDAPPQAPWGFEADHYHPCSSHAWLAYDYTNLRPAHSKCNRSRGAKADDLSTWVAPNGEPLSLNPPARVKARPIQSTRSRWVS